MRAAIHELDVGQSHAGKRSQVKDAILEANTEAETTLRPIPTDPDELRAGECHPPERRVSYGRSGKVTITEGAIDETAFVEPSLTQRATRECAGFELLFSNGCAVEEKVSERRAFER